MRIVCPFCGERDYTEFRYGGDAAKLRPALDDPDPKAWHDHLFLFDNPKGPHTEYWQHVLGCRQWFKLSRDTATNKSSPFMGEDSLAEGEAGGGSV